MRLKLLKLLPAASVFWSSCAFALGMTPMEMEMSAAGSAARTQFSVSNDSTEAVPVEVSVSKLSYTEDGKRITTAGGDDLLVTPATAIIAPGSTQTFRIQWVGSPDIDKSQSFLVSANQLPVRDNSGRARIQVVEGFGAILNVAPVNGVADLKLISTSPAKLPSGEAALSILVENPTRTHALIANSALRVGPELVSPDTMRTRVGFGVVEPGKRRRFLVPLQSPSSGAGATLEYRNNR